MDERKLLETAKKLAELHEEVRKYEKLVSEISEVLYTVVTHLSWPTVRDVEVPCAHAPTTTLSWVELERIDGTARFTGSEIKFLSKRGSVLATLYLGEITMATLVALMLLEEAEGLLSKLLAKVKEVNDELAKRLEKLRKAVALVRMAFA